MKTGKQFWGLHQRQIKAVLGVSAVFLGLQLAYLNASPVSTGKPLTLGSQKKFAKGQILVHPKAGLSEDEFDKVISGHGGKQKHKIEQIRVHVIEVPEGAEEAVAKALSHNPKIEFAEVDELVPSVALTNDTYLGSEWHIPNIGAPAAWDISRGDGVVIAILDSGVDGTHPDLASRMVPGYNFYDSNTDSRDVVGHGTKVAGAAAAIGNNAMGVAGVAWNSLIMPLRVSDLQGWAQWSRMASALTWAADHGARVANMSYMVQGSSSVQSAAQYFRNKGGVAVNSAGNTGALDASAASDTLITVSATSSLNTRTSWSSFGAYVDISAPGSGIYTTTMGGGYGAVNGTSFSSPITAGVLALMMSKNPNLTPSQLSNILLSTATDLGDAGWDQYYGRGLVNAAAAVQAAANAVATDSQVPTVSISGLASGSVVKGIVPINVSAADNTAVTGVDLFVDGKLIGSDAMAPYAYSWDTSTLSDGNHTLNAKAYDAAGNMGTVSVTVSVRNTTDSVAPVVTISNPLSGSVLKTNVSIQSSATDNIGVVSMVLYVDGVQKASSLSGSLNYTLNSKKMSAGSHIIRVDAKDATGNLGTKSIQVSK